jgi:hypothetical protein
MAMILVADADKRVLYWSPTREKCDPALFIIIDIFGLLIKYP